MTDTYIKTLYYICIFKILQHWSSTFIYIWWKKVTGAWNNCKINRKEYLLPVLVQLNYVADVLDLQVFSAHNVELVTKTRTEHLTDQDKQRSKKIAKSPLESFLGLAEKEEKNKAAAAGAVTNGVHTLLWAN